MLGKIARCKVTGFTGLITGVGNFIDGRAQALVTPPAAAGSAEWIDTRRLEVAKDEPVAPAAKAKRKAKKR